MKNIIAFSGSNNPNSINQQLIHIVSNYVEENNINESMKVNVEVLNIRDYPAEMYGMEEEANGFPPSMQALCSKMQSADGFIISSPEHNGSIPAVLKNTMDWLSRMEGKIYNGKPLVLLSTSPGVRGGASVLQHLLNITPYHGAKVIGGHGVGTFHDKVVDNNLVAGEDRKKIQALIKELVQAL